VSWAPVNWTVASPLRRVLAAGRRRIASTAVPTPKPADAPAAPVQSTPSLRDWLGILAMVVGLFMAIMDVQIVTSSLTQIQGGLSASADEISWVQTSYLIADVVMVPLS
jgi:DHA2 family multidrug resistance protein